MSERYKVRDTEETYFITLTIVDWVDLFTRARYVDILHDAMNYCIKSKGLIIYAYVIMPSHVHMLATGSQPLNDIIRDLKKHTSKEFITAINEIGESRKEWLLNKFAYEAKRIKRGKNYKVWKDGFHPKIMDRTEKLEAAYNYIHYNPIAAGYVAHEQDWLASSARAYLDDSKCDVDITSVW